jgi:hypothetical protein
MIDAGKNPAQEEIKVMSGPSAHPIVDQGSAAGGETHRLHIFGHATQWSGQ